MRRLFARLLTSSARLFHAVVNHLLGRRARRAQAATGHRARLLLAPMENRDHTGQLAGGVVLAALGCQLTDPLQGMALAVGDLAMLAAPPAEAASQPTVGDPPRPLTRWLPDDWNAAALAFSAEGQSSGSASADNEADQLAAARAIDPLDNFWAIPVAGASFEAAPALPPLPAPDGAAPPGPNSSDGVTAIGASGTLPPLGEVPAAPAPREGEPGRAPDQPAQHVGSLNRSEQTEPDLTPEPFSIAANALAQLPETPDQLLNNQLASPDSIFVQSVHRYGQGAGSRLFVAGLVQTSATAGTPLTIDFASEGRLLGSTPVTADGSGATGFQTVLPATANEQAVVATVRGGASSAPVSVTAAPDGDLDGVPDWIEARVPGRSGDANLPGVASLPLGTGDAYATIDAGTLRLTRVSTFTVPSSLPASTFSDGLFSFAVEGVTPGGLATITLTLPPGPRSGGYAKWDPVTNRVTDFSFDGTTGAVIDGNVITLTLQDGGRGDADGVVNGTILDPGGPSEAIGTIGDVVWIDDDGDGVQDPNEPGFPGVSVELYDPSGTMVLATTTTNTGGQYTFSAIGGADYRVKFILPSGYQFSPQHTGSDATDSDADPGTGLTPAFFLPTGGAVNAADAGMRPPGPAVITGRVWDDSDGDGVQNPSEGGGPEGAVVRLYDESGTTLLTTTGIGNNGSYSFTAVSGTYYRIEV
ncbi:MAG TPA: SdrD B-like domain-containing protein, partial [Gemmata sp.]